MDEQEKARLKSEYTDHGPVTVISDKEYYFCQEHNCYFSKEEADKTNPEIEGLVDEGHLGFASTTEVCPVCELKQVLSVASLSPQRERRWMPSGMPKYSHAENPSDSLIKFVKTNDVNQNSDQTTGPTDLEPPSGHFRKSKGPMEHRGGLVRRGRVFS